ncbi:MAG: hypothetical protein ABH817_02150 [archaeon]
MVSGKTLGILVGGIVLIGGAYNITASRLEYRDQMRKLKNAQAISVFIQPNENLYRLFQRYGAKAEGIKFEYFKEYVTQKNELENPDMLQVNQQLVIPNLEAELEEQ